MFKLPNKFRKLTAVSKLLQQYVTRQKQVVNLAEALGAIRYKAEKVSKEPSGKGDGQKKVKGVCAGVKTEQTNKTNAKGSSDIEDKCDIFKPKHSNEEFWRKLSLMVVPAVLLTSFVVLATQPEPPERNFIPYEYLYRHNKRFPWGDGRLSLFHGKHNFDPQEEEERIDSEQEEGAEEGGEEQADKGKKPRYKERVDEKQVKAELREQHAKEELKRRKRRHEIEKENPYRLKRPKPKEDKDNDEHEDEDKDEDKDKDSKTK